MISKTRFHLSYLVLSDLVLLSLILEYKFEGYVIPQYLQDKLACLLVQNFPSSMAAVFSFSY